MSTSVKASPQTFNTGLYGTARTNKYGTTYDPTAFERNLVNTTTSYIPQYLEQMVNPTYDSDIFKARTAQRNRLANQSFENNVINPLAARGLTRGSSINQLSGQFANKLADLEVDAMADEDTRNANMVNNLMTYYQIPYEIMMGISNFNNKQYQQAVANALAQNQTNNKSMNNLANSIGTVANLALKAAQYGGGMSGLGTSGLGTSGLGTPGVNSTGMSLGSLLGAGIGASIGNWPGAQVGSMIGGQIGGWLG